MALAAALIAGGALVAGGGAAAVRAAKVSGQNARGVNYGGSQDALQQYRDQYGQGIGTAQDQQQRGLTALGQGVGDAYQIGQYGQKAGERFADRGYEYLNQGNNQFGAGLRTQEQALAMLGQAAQGQAPSAAQLMMQQQAALAARQGQALATTARGGNQAAAMRNAQMVGMEGQAQAAQAGAVLRAQEMAQARGALADYGLAQYGQGVAPAQMGLQAIGQGTGQALAAQQYGNQAQLGAGQYLAGLGASREATYLGAQQNVEQQQLAAQLEYERNRAAGRQRKSDRLWGLAGTLVGAGGQVASMGFKSGGGGNGGGGGGGGG